MSSAPSSAPSSLAPASLNPSAASAPIAQLQAPSALPAYQRGDFIGDLLQVIETLGEGGFGIVYLARSLASNDIVALKTLRGELLRDPRTRAMFEKEARIWMDLGAHPNLVRAKWVDEIGGRLYIAMEYVQAGAGRPNSLEGHLEKGPIPTDQALLWGIQFCRGMEYAVSRGVRCHRDIKPANILIGSDGVVKISDFGIAGLALVPEAPSGSVAHAAANPGAWDDSAKTVVGTVFGTPTHMPPEQFVDAASCDERSDIYSFGVVLYQMASGGRLPFLPPPPPPALAGQAGAYYWHAFRTLHGTASEAPLTSPLAGVIARALRKKREDRYPGFAALRADLEALYQKAKGEQAPALAEVTVTANDWNNKGISLATLNRWAEALACYDKALALEPESAAIHNNRGNALRNLGRVDEAVAEFDRSIAKDPLYAAAWENKALLYARAQRNEEALACIERSLALDPTAAAAWGIKGVMLGRLKRPDEELAAYDHALRIDPRNVEAWFNKANLLSTVNRPEALECVDQVLACDPAFVSGWDLKGTLLSESGRANEAVACHQEARRLDPQDGRLAYNLGNSWSAIGRLEEARAAYEDATRLAPDMAVTWYNLALATFRLNRFPESIPLFDYFLSLDPPHDGLRRTAERLTGELKAGRTPSLGDIGVGSRITSDDPATVDAGALPQLQPVVPTSPGPPISGAAIVAEPPPQEPLPEPRPSLDALNRQATTHFNAGRFAESMSVVESILEIEPREEYALNSRANTMFKLGRRDEACLAALRAIEVSPGELRFWINKAFIEKGAGRLNDAARSAVDLIEIAQAAADRGGPVDQARGLLKELQNAGVTPSPRSYPGWLGLGFASMRAGRTNAGFDFFDRAVASAPDNVEVLRWKGHACKERKRADDALSVYERALALSPHDPDLHHDCGIALAMLREFSRAVEAFDRALALNPNHVASLSDKGKYAGELKRYDEALIALRRAAALMPDHPAPWLNKALVEDILHRDEDALLSFERFLQHAKPEMRLQIESSKRRVEQLRARVAARRGSAAPRPQAPPASVPATVTADERSPDALMEAASRLLADDDMSDEELAHIAQAIGGDRSLLDILRPGTSDGTIRPAPPASPPSPAAPIPTGLAESPAAARPTGNPVAKKWAEQARSLLAAHKPVEALAAVDKAIERDPHEALYWAERGTILKALSRHDQARAAWTKALTLRAACVPALLGLASAEGAAGRYHEAIPWLTQACGHDPGNAKAWFELGDAYRQLSDWSNAYSAFSVSLKIAVRNAPGVVGLAEAALNLGRVDEAADALEAALALDATDASAWYLRGAALSRKGLIAEAVEAERRAVELDPGRANAWYNLAHDLYALKRHDDALEAANRALRIRPDFAFALNTKGLALHALRRFDEAVAVFDQRLLVDSSSAQAWANKGTSLLSLKRHQEALDCFNRALEIKPDHQAAVEGRASAQAAVAAAHKAATAAAENEQRRVAGQLVLPEATIPKTAPKFSQWDPLESTCRHASLSIL